MGYPERGLNFIHLAGTNGKGSTAAALDGILREAGFFPGLYTSPHLVDYRERFQLGGQPVSREILLKNLAPILRLIRRMPRSVRPTFFEATTALALKIFRDCQVDFVVWETGLGGRLDATNLVRPELCLLTSLGKDHEEILGEGWARIGAEKAGILKRGVPVFSAPWPLAAQRVLSAKVKQLGCPWRVVEPLAKTTDRLPLVGRHQRQNLALAVAAARYLGFPDRIIGRGLARTRWPGRFSLWQKNPRIVVDGAHNEEGVRAAWQTWNEIYGTPPARVIFGCLRDKPVDRMLAQIRRARTELWGVALQDPRGSDPLSWGVHPTRYFLSVREALEADRANPLRGGTLILGSLVLVGEVLAFRDLPAG